jgi:hypothetical protein
VLIGLPAWDLLVRKYQCRGPPILVKGYGGVQLSQLVLHTLTFRRKNDLTDTKPLTLRLHRGCLVGECLKRVCDVWQLDATRCR